MRDGTVADVFVAAAHVGPRAGEFARGSPHFWTESRSSRARAPMEFCSESDVQGPSSTKLECRGGIRFGRVYRGDRGGHRRAGKPARSVLPRRANYLKLSQTASGQLRRRA
jgi:hypothetical protein